MVSKTTRPQVPYEDEIDDLTIDYPSSDGEPMAESEWQYTPLTETVSTLRVRYHGRDDVYVGGELKTWPGACCFWHRTSRPL